MRALGQYAAWSHWQLSLWLWNPLLSAKIGTLWQSSKRSFHLQRRNCSCFSGISPCSTEQQLHSEYNEYASKHVWKRVYVKTEITDNSYSKLIPQTLFWVIIPGRREGRIKTSLAAHLAVDFWVWGLQTFIPNMVIYSQGLSSSLGFCNHWTQEELLRLSSPGSTRSKGI